MTIGKQRYYNIILLLCKIRINKTKEVYLVFGDEISYFDDLQQNIDLFNFIIIKLVM